MKHARPFQMLNVAPLLDGYEKEMAQDVLALYSGNAISETAFIMTLVPEGNPVADKAAMLAEKYRKQRAAIGETEMPVGILLQATMGHGWAPNAQAPFQKLKVADGSTPYMFCPLDTAFQRYIFDAVRKLAALKPDFFMLDDDFRMLTGRGGCFCPLHIARFNEITGKNYTEKTLREAVKNDAAVARAYDKLLMESLVSLAKLIRQAIDESDPATPCSFCMCCEDVRHVAPIVEALTAKGDTPTLRINHGMYLQDSPRGFHRWLYKTARQVLAFPAEWQILGEPDTCPQNRYSTSAALMHAHITHSIIEGTHGGKLWITPTRSYEPESGTLYRKTLTENAGFYRMLAALPVRWEGVATPLPETPPLNFPMGVNDFWPDCNWSSEVFGKMGIPFYYSTAPVGMTALAGDDVGLFNDAELKAVLEKNPLLIDGTAAVALAERGFAKTLGFAAETWKGDAVSFELEPESTKLLKASAALPYAKLTPASGFEVLSSVYHSDSGLINDAEPVLPGVIRSKKALVFAIPVSRLSLAAFGMLSQTRKEQLIRLLTGFDAIPCYVPGDHEVLMKTGMIPEDTMYR